MPRNFFIDEAVLAATGIPNFGHYAVIPGSKLFQSAPLMPAGVLTLSPDSSMRNPGYRFQREC